MNLYREVPIEIGTKSIKQVGGIISAYPQYKSEDSSNSISAAMSRDNKQWYIDVYTTKDYVYTLYSGKTFRDAVTKAFETDMVLVFDWRGNPIKKYKLNVAAAQLCVSPDDRILYAVANNPEPELVYFNLK